MESKTLDSYSNLFLNNFKNLNSINDYFNQTKNSNKNLTKNLINSLPIDSLNGNNDLNYLQTEQNQEMSSLSLDDKNSIILTRIIISGISFIACLICIIIYLYLCVKKTIETRKENQQKAELMNQMDNEEDLDDFEEKGDDKKERFLTCDDMEEEKIENEKGLRLSLFSRKDKDETVSFENVIAQNKSVSFKKKFYNPYSSNQSKLIFFN